MKLYSLILVSMISFSVSGQIRKSELVTFNDENFIKSIQKLIKSRNNCVSESISHNWYIESQKNGSFIVSINRIGNLLQSLEKKNIYTTLINNQIVFYITQNDNNDILETSYFIDLSKYVDYEYVLFEDFSSWLIVKDNNNFVIKEKNLFKCNH